MLEMNNTFIAKIEKFEIEIGWYYVSVPADLRNPLVHLAGHYGMIAVTATLGTSCWPTSLMPKGDGTHFIPLSANVRKKEKLSLGMEVEISFETRTK